jgi:hypothetical protein
MAVRPEGANHLWRKNPPRELSIDLVTSDLAGKPEGLESRDKGRFRWLSDPMGRNVSEAQADHSLQRSEPTAADGRLWHISDIGRCLLFRRYQGHSGHESPLI